MIKLLPEVGKEPYLEDTSIENKLDNNQRSEYLL